MSSFQIPQHPQYSQPMHSLGQELGAEHIGNWMGNSHERAEWEEEYQNQVLRCFDLDGEGTLDRQGHWGKKENQKEEETEREERVEEAEEIRVVQGQIQGQPVKEQKQQVVQQSSDVSQSGQTFYEQSNLSTTVAGQSLWQAHCDQALHQFITLSQTTYTPMLNHYKQILTKTKLHSDKSLQNLNMYHLFLSIKLVQEQERCEVVQKYKNGTMKNIQGNLLMDAVYLDQKVVIEQLMAREEDKVQGVEHFCEEVQESCTKLKTILSKSLEFRTKKLDHITSYIDRTQRIQKQLLDLILRPSESSDQNSSYSSSEPWFSKAEMRGDRYLQRKYLQERQRIFLSQLKAIGQKLLALLHSIFIKEEPIIAAVLGKEIGRYYKLSRQIYGGEMNEMKRYSQNVEVDMDNVQEQLYEVLQGIIPKQWKIQNQSKDSDNLIEETINGLHGYLHNQIFLPTIEMDQEFILVRQKARWVAKGEENPSDKHGHKRMSACGKENRLEGANQATCSALFSDREIPKGIFTKSRGIQVSAVLTADRYLHFQCGQKIACLKLKKLKLKRKGERSILFYEKHGSISSLFAATPYLGELMFANEELTDKFTSIVMSTLQ